MPICRNLRAMSMPTKSSGFPVGWNSRKWPPTTPARLRRCEPPVRQYFAFVRFDQQDPLFADTDLVQFRVRPEVGFF